MGYGQEIVVLGRIDDEGNAPFIPVDDSQKFNGSDNDQYDQVILVW
jgi:hypothetical protein